MCANRYECQVALYAKTGLNSSPGPGPVVYDVAKLSVLLEQAKGMGGKGGLAKEPVFTALPKSARSHNLHLVDVAEAVIAGRGHGRQSEQVLNSPSSPDAFASLAISGCKV